MKDNLGDRMKEYESAETARKFLPLLPVYARIDGRCFSNFTRGLARPYDLNMSRTMIETTKSLVEMTHAKIGYTQSDEINLVWYSPDHVSKMIFEGKIQKLVSVLASMATTSFIQHCSNHGLGHRVLERPPTFDCRVFQLPNKVEAANAFLWREKDATKNAISMAARSYYSSKELHGKSSKEMQEMIFQQGWNFNDYPAFFKRGTFVRRVVEERAPTAEELQKIPEEYRIVAMTALRSKIVELAMPNFTQVANRTEVIFDGAEPIFQEQKL